MYVDFEHKITNQFNDAPEPIYLNQAGRYLENKVGAVTHLQSPLNTHPDTGAHSTSTSESNPDYYRPLSELNSNWRLVLCKDGIQWILQKKRGSKKWEGKWFARTKEGLLRGLLGLESKGEIITEAAWQFINKLPVSVNSRELASHG